jgi:hypothetical protein
MENGQAPATKGDLALLRSEVKGDLALLRSEVKGDIAQLRSEVKGDIAVLRSELKEDVAILRSEMQHIHDNLVETLRDSQTELLKAFYNFGTSNSKRMTELEGNEGALRSRVATLEDRVMDLERRLITPPEQRQ